MNKLVRIISLITVLGLLLSACGGGTPATEAPVEATEAPTEAVTEAPVEPTCRYFAYLGR